MTDNNSGDIGTVKIANEVVAAYISNAVTNTEGVAGFYSGFSDTISQTLLGKESKYRGIKIDSNEKGYTVDIYVILEFGCRIPAVAWAIQKNVKNQLEDIMFLEIESINIHVQGVINTNDSDLISHDSTIEDKSADVFDEVISPNQNAGEEE